MPRIDEVIYDCIEGKVKSKELAYKTFYGYLMAIILRYVKDRSDAEELINDTFVKIFRSIHQFIIPENDTLTEVAFRGWIAKIASRTAIDFLRKRKPMLSLEEVEVFEEPITQVNVISQLHVKDILKLLDQLPDLHRLVFNLYEIEGFPHHEVAKLLNIPESSSRVYLVRAKQKLRVLYSKTLIHSHANIG